ncbi:MAG: GGDEF domain-containing protein [Thermoleophilia bacterium]
MHTSVPSDAAPPGREPLSTRWRRGLLGPEPLAAGGQRGPLRMLVAPPADRHAATRAMAVMLLGGAAFMGVLSAAVPSFAHGQIAMTVLIVAILGGSGLAVWRWPGVVPSWAFGLAPYPAAATVLAANLATSDASAGAQLFLLWPVLYAAMFLSVAQTSLVLAAVTVADGLVTATILPGSVAVTDTAGLATALAIACAVIFVLRRRVADLMAALERQALEDQLTGLLNRRALDVALTSALATHRRRNAPVSLLTIDVDGFKHVNDVSGHAAGDTALRHVADVLRASVRAGDVLGRMGGDEFVVILADCTRDGGRRVAEQIRAGVEAARVGVTVSIGVATAPEDGADADALSRASDAALYGAKLGGRNRVVTA